MLIREVPIFVLSHKNSRVLEGRGVRGGSEGGWGKVGSERGGGCGGVGACVCGGGGRLREGEGAAGAVWWWWGGRWREGNRGCIKYAWKSKKISLQIIGVVTEGLKQHCLP